MAEGELDALVLDTEALRALLMGEAVLGERVMRAFLLRRARLIGEVASGRLTALIDKTFPLSEAAAAHAYIESRQAVGRVLLIP